jgi:hypothetical protein
MYCSNCGAQASGNFCFACGAKLAVDQPVAMETSTADSHATSGIPANPLLDNNYALLLQSPDVRRLIEHYAKQAPSNRSAEDFLKLADHAVKPFTKVSFATIAQIIVPIYQQLGIKTGKSYSNTFAISIQDMIIKILCSLAKNGYPLQSVERASNGLLFLARLNSDMWTWGGDIVITLENQDSKTSVSIDVKIKGQLYDWGKSKSIIEKISTDIVGIMVH